MSCALEVEVELREAASREVHGWWCCEVVNQICDGYILSCASSDSRDKSSLVVRASQCRLPSSNVKLDAGQACLPNFPSIMLRKP
jgi:hypothetical protein